MFERIWIIPPLLALAGFCIFGFLATFEPGNDTLMLRIVYAVGVVLCLVGCVLTWAMTRNKPKA